MTQHTDLIERLRCFDRVTCNEAADALEAQAREIAELKAQESELCTLYGLAQAECKKLRTELDYSQMAADAEARRVDELTEECQKLRKDAMRWQNQYNELRHLVDRRPAINAGPIEAYMRWNTECYLLDFHNADDESADAAMSQKGQP